jgi:alpha-tubulin suppressor-like RCC1 family protein
VPPGLTNVVRIAAGDFHSMAVRADGSVVTWGDNQQGQCTVPEGVTNVVAVSGGGVHSLALKADGTVSAWGGDAAGQCDLASGLGDVVGISGGEVHSLILIRSGAPDARLLNATWSGGVFSAIVQTLNRNNYALEYSPSLTPQVWTAVTTNSGNGGLEMLSDPAATGQPRFYRMRQW